MGYSFLMWGFVLMASIDINGVDLIPDILGYASMLIGCQMLQEQNRNYKVASYLCIAAIVISVRQFAPILGIVIPENSLIDVVEALLATTIYFAIIGFICKGIGEVAQTEQNGQLVKLARKTWIINLISVISLISVIGTIESEPVIILTFVALIFTVISYFINIILMKKAAEELPGYQPDYEA